jgi:hypothetical protein
MLAFLLDEKHTVPLPPRQTTGTVQATILGSFSRFGNVGT